MEKRVLLIIALLILYGCENTQGQYRHDQKHHEQQDRENSELEKVQRQINP